MNKLKLLLKEIKDLHSFFWKTKKEEKEMVFYTEHQGYYPNFEGIIKKLIEKNKTICYITSDSTDPILKNQHPKIKAFYINKLLIFLMTSLDCKVCIMTMADLNQFHIKRSLKPVHYVYLFHALVSTHMVYRPGAFDHYDSILCTGPYQIKEIQKHEKLNNLKPKKLIEAGYYRLERIYDAYEKYPKKKSTKKTILIAPSWGTKNILESCGEHLIELLLKIGYKIIVRPHPEAVRRSPDLINSFNLKFGNNPDFTLEKSVTSDDSLLKSDILISDYSGIALEYAFGTERPVLFLDTPPKVNNPKFNELEIKPLELFIRSKIGKIVSPQKLETVPKIIAKLIKNEENYKEIIAKLRKQYVYNFGYSSEIGAEHIINILSRI